MIDESMKKLLLMLLLFISFSIRVNAAPTTPDIQINKIYVDNKEVDKSPAKDEGYYFLKTDCTNGVKGTWNNETWELELSNITKSVSCSVFFTSSAEEAKKNITNPETGTFINNQIVYFGLLTALVIIIIVIRKKKFYRV